MMFALFLLVFGKAALLVVVHNVKLEYGQSQLILCTVLMDGPDLWDRS